MYRAPTHRWYLERIIWLIAGIVVLGGIILGLLVSKYWFILPILAGLNMIVFALTGFCPMAVILNSIFGVEPLNKMDKEKNGG